MQRTRWAAGVRAAISGIVVVSGLAAIHLTTATSTAAASAAPDQPELLGVTLGPAHAPVGSHWTPHRVCAAARPGMRHCDAIELLPASSTPAASAAATTPTTNLLQGLLCLLLNLGCPPPTTPPPPPTTTSTSTSTTSTSTTSTSTTSTSTSTTSTSTTTTSTSTTTTIAPTTTTTIPAAPCASAALPPGYAPCDLQAAYGLLAASGTSPTRPGVTVAIVDAQDDPNAESDLQVYRQRYGLPTCTTANGCFKKVNQSGVQGSYPTGDTGWGGEISLDIDMVSAICPRCSILLVETKSASNNDLDAGVNRAVAMGATAISLSWGGVETSADPSDATFSISHPGVAITAAAGDDGYDPEFPATSPNVIAVGGTTLSRSGSAPRGFVEGVWSDTGGGCSAYETQPAWQAALGKSGCNKRIANDVAADADPNTGVAVYDTYGGSSAGATGWEIYGGTSASAPMIAGVYALADNNADNASSLYQNPSALNDVTAGNNGTCSPQYLCNGEVGYDAPTGLGTPKGITAF